MISTIQMSGSLDRETDHKILETLAILQDHKNIMQMLQEYEAKQMNPMEETNFFQYIFDAGIVWTMPQPYINRLKDLLEKNLIYSN